MFSFQYTIYNVTAHRKFNKKIIIQTIFVSNRGVLLFHVLRNKRISKVLS